MTYPNLNGVSLRVYLASSLLIELVGPVVLRHRLARGKEDPERVSEKYGQASLPRSDGILIWLHAVGLGEVLALRGLITEMAKLDASVNFLITSSTKSSAQVISTNLPPRTIHQYLPLDAPSYVSRFLDHWRPDLSIWSEQELWPGAIVETYRRGVPLALVNARITDESLARRERVGRLFGDLLARFSLISAQDEISASHLLALGANEVRVAGSLKSAAPPLRINQGTLTQVGSATRYRRIWVAASTHPGDEVQAVAAQKELWLNGRRWLLILVPRDVGRAEAIASYLAEARLSFAQRSIGELPAKDDAVFLSDTYGEMGVWYSLADATLIGGGFDKIGGHNPWEAAHFNTAILHGPNFANFVSDYKALHAKNAARTVSAGELPTALQDDDLPAMASRARGMLRDAAMQAEQLAVELLALVNR